MDTLTGEATYQNKIKIFSLVKCGSTAKRNLCPGALELIPFRVDHFLKVLIIKEILCVIKAEKMIRCSLFL